MDLRQLRGLVAIVDHGSFTAAARALHTSQQSLSYLISRLEAEVGSRVFDRAAGGVRLTAVGEAMLEPARLAIYHTEQAGSAAHATTGLIVGRLTIAPVRFAVPALEPLLVDFHDRYPNVVVTLEDPKADRQVVDAVRAGGCELGLCRDATAARELRAVSLGWTGVIAVFPSGAAPTTSRISVEQLARYPLIAPVSGSPERRYFDAALGSMGLQPQIAAECTDREMGFALVRAGFGTLLQPQPAGDIIARPGLDAVPLPRRFGFELFLIQRPGEPSPAAASFYSVLQQSSPRHQQWGSALSSGVTVGM